VRTACETYTNFVHPPLQQFGGLQGLPDDLRDELKQKLMSLGGRVKGVSFMAFDVPM
jgi:hypothetical protein